ncbi:kinesin-like protein KIF21A isoform X1 [Drosophila novamexicana]|uniref:kinesin-like protein KIF21A isoform X1 n=2 Tax=Drosophila novamexicana TaxID=47314 RepID=UPI0011E59CB8|nr:kinesin-like protein KIF21A isoform X1 [Drosophila novamexicana]
MYQSIMATEADAADKDCLVRVAVRIRPQNSRELIDMCRICTTVTPGEQQIVLGSDKAFTFDYVYDVDSNQCDIYTECVERLVEGTLYGYNATVLAYGQTGSGKTYTMGSGLDPTSGDYRLGIIPRAIRHIFAGIERMQHPEDNDVSVTNSQFSVAVQFIELYNEDIIDLLDPFNKNSTFKIHESGNGEINIAGATIKPINEPQEALKFLQQGALARTTASTKMNDLSSRSHAVFTIFVRRQHVVEPKVNFVDSDFETLTSKFHFVDLAGSERLKRTLATGERAREGISINCGLLALGNCISALGDKSKKASHVPYRDSKLTRLLQDSLGGNSQTLMIACISPSDRDFMETLNTLKYANRARNIKNKVQINQDQSSRTISLLRREVAALQLELLEYKQGKRVLDSQGNTSISDTFYENTMLLADNKRLQQRLKSMQETINILVDRNAQLKLEKQTHEWANGDSSDITVANMVGNYIMEIEKLQAKLLESEDMCQQLKKYNSTGNSPRANKTVRDDPSVIIDIAKRGLEKERELLMFRSLPGIPNENNHLIELDFSDSESDPNEKEMEDDLNEINSDIEIKTKLIEQLELSQERMQVMRQHYEEKLTALTSKIFSTQKERDEVLANMASSSNNQPKDNLKSVKMEYERKLNDMNRELKRLQQTQREHIRQQKELKTQEIKLQNLRMELNELKCSKVRLMKKISEQTSQHREENTRKTREIAQLRKEQRRQKNEVLSLQAKMSAKEQILKRKTEEVSALRRSQRSGHVWQRTTKQSASKMEQTRSLHHRWETLSRTIIQSARNKQLISQLETELERLVKEREQLCRELKIIKDPQNVEGGSEYSNEEDNLKTNIGYVQENIEHVQKAIMEFEDMKDPAHNDAFKIQGILDTISTVEEAKYLLQKLSDNAIFITCNSSMIENRLQEHEALLKEAQHESGIQQQILQFFLANSNNEQILDLFDSLNMDDKLRLNNLNRSWSQKSLISNGTYDIPREEPSFIEEQVPETRCSPPITDVENCPDKSPKVRGRTARRHDLLFGETGLPSQTLKPHHLDQLNVIMASGSESFQ